MKRKFSNILLLASLVCIIPWAVGYAQLDMLHGDQAYSASGLHSGNQIKTNFYNDGMIGQRQSINPNDVGGEWPINSGHTYLSKVATFFGSEVRGTDGQLRPIVSESNGTATHDPGNHSSGDFDPNSPDWWTMTPLPGFYNETPPPEESDKPRVAMSHWRWSWPATWPDKMDDSQDPGWAGSWNGYFGKDILNADQESYYVMDDYMNREFPFYPDSTDSLRRGLGFRVTVRGFQWSNVMVEDCIFWLYDVKNIGTHSHDKVAFGVMSGPYPGHDNTGGDGDDDGGRFDLDKDLGYQYDQDNIGASGWSPVGILGIAYFESPGNPFDGLDNDGDGRDGPGPVVSTSMFDPVTVNAGDDVILTDYQTYERTVAPMPANGVHIHYAGRDTTILPGQLQERPNNLIDDNLNGLIDENNGTVYGDQSEYLYVDHKYIDYATGAGENNLLLEERRDDGIDNDGDWDALFDDVGLDGVPNTGDPGEGDGVPTSGAGTNLPGEPHIDKTDIDESDMIGLTSYLIYSDLGAHSLQYDDQLWADILPGHFSLTGEIGDTDVILGSGYFPLQPGDIERYSVGYIMGGNNPGSFDTRVADLYRNKERGQQAYDANYNFAKAPLIPKVTAVPGDGRVTLYWDNRAEESIDPLTGKDFEGYKIYRSTSPDWTDLGVITDGYGSEAARQPIAQYDLDNDIKGFTSDEDNGLIFYLGDDTGLEHAYVDSTVNNGQTYYYAVSAYDHGSVIPAVADTADTLGLPPSETSKYISITPDGKIDKGINVAVVTPEAPVAGYTDATVQRTWEEGSTNNGTVAFRQYDRTLIENKQYEVTFQDSAYRYRQWDYPATKNFTLVDITDAANPDTLVKQDTTFGRFVTIPGDRGFEILLQNKEELTLNSDKSGWNHSGVLSYNYFRPTFTFGTAGLITGIPFPSSYRIEFVDSASTTSTDAIGFPAIPANIKIFNTTLDKEIQFAFKNGADDGMLTANDEVFFLENVNDSLVATWSLRMASPDSELVPPQAGDVLTLYNDIPFLSRDVLTITTNAARVDEGLAKNSLDNIKVVPNPYVVTNSFEPKNPYATGRGPRELHFIHLPRRCTIRIFNIRGQLVRTLEHNSSIYDGTEVWDLLTKDQLDVAYGIYIYHVEAKGIGNKIGKFAIIK